MLAASAFAADAPEIAKARQLWSESPHGRMLERILPPAIAPNELPEPGSEGARLTVRYCVQCHHLPNPRMHTADKWSGIVERMVWRMQGKGNLGFPAPLLYPLSASDFHDVTSGSNGNAAGPGYDLASGRGSVIWSAAYAELGGGGGDNQPPTASFNVQHRGLTVRVTDTSTDSDGTIASRQWDSGDGRSSTQSPLTYRYPSAGTYTVTLTVTDDDGATGTTSQSITVP